MALGNCTDTSTVGVPGVQPGVLHHFLVSAAANATAGTPFAVTVTAQDGSNTTLAGYTGTIHFSSSDPGAPVLPGNYTFVGSDAGSHTFPAVTLKTAGSQTLGVSDVAATGKVGSTTITVAAGPAARLAFGQQPTGTIAGNTIAPPTTVLVQDAYGNQTASTPAIAMAIGPNPGGATLGGTTTQTAAGGIGTFGDLTLDKPGTGYTLVASSSGLIGATELDVRHRSGSRRRSWLLRPNPRAGANLAAGASTSFVVTVKDGVGNTVGTDNSTTVSLALSSNPGSSTLTCAGGTGPVTVTAGVATFSCSLNKLGSGYKVTTTNSAGLTEAASNSFNVVAATASQLVITTQPVSGTASSSATLGPITVQRQDASGNPVTTGSTTVNLSSSSSGDKFSISSGGGATTTVTIPNNSSTANVYYGDTVAGTPTIALSAGGFTSATQQATINPAAATKLGFTTQPGGGVAGAAWAQPPTVAILDSFGNAVPGASASITVAIRMAPRRPVARERCRAPRPFRRRGAWRRSPACRSIGWEPATP